MAFTGDRSRLVQYAPGVFFDPSTGHYWSGTGWDDANDLGTTPPNPDLIKKTGSPPPSGTPPPGTTSYDPPPSGMPPPSNPNPNPTAGGPPQFPLPPPSYTPPPGGYGGPAPTYTPPPAFSYADYTPSAPFTGPTGDAILSDPSYQFRFAQGQGALENSRAAGGTLNSGATGQALVNYGQDFASQEYQHAWDRNLNAYNTNEDTRFKTYSTNYLAAADAYKTNVDNQFVTPMNFAQDAWKTRAGSDQRAGEFDYNSAYNNWLSAYNIWRNTANDWFEKQWKVAGS